MGLYASMSQRLASTLPKQLRSYGAPTKDAISDRPNLNMALPVLRFFLCSATQQALPRTSPTGVLPRIRVAIGRFAIFRNYGVKRCNGVLSLSRMP